MFENIGKKIKNLASVITWMGIILSVVVGIVLIVLDESLIATGLIIMVAGFLMSWISSFLLYGFGQLVDNSDKLVRANGMDPYDLQTEVQKPDYLLDLLQKGLITEEDYRRRKGWQ